MSVPNAMIAHMLTLSDRDRRLLEFEEQYRRHSGAKEAGIRDEFGMTSTRYYQLLNAAIDRPAALAEFPLLVKGLLRARDRRERNRTMRELG